MQLRHVEKGFTIQVTSKRGKPILNKQGFVNIERGIYKQCRTMPLEVLEKKFEVAS